MVLSKQKYRSMEQNRKLGGKSTHLWTPWEKAMAPHSSTVARKIPWMEEPGRLHSMGSLRVRHGWSDLAAAWTPSFWPRKKKVYDGKKIVSSTNGAGKTTCKGMKLEHFLISYIKMNSFRHFHFLLSCIGERNGNPLQCCCLENPMDGEAW